MRMKESMYEYALQESNGFYSIAHTTTTLHCADWSQIFSSLDQMEYRTCPVENYDSTRPTKGQIYDCWPLETAMYGSSSGGYSQK